MYTLGINAAFHGPAATLVKDGVVLAAAEEERFTHIKHGKRPIPFSTYKLPYNAIDFCLKKAEIRLTDVHHIAYSFDPNLLLGEHKDKRTIEIPSQPGESTPGESTPDPYQWQYVNHHVAHAASAFLPSPHERAAVMVLDDLKDREEFRPVGPTVLEEAADTYFLNARQSPFMLFVNEVRPGTIDAIPAVTHTDGTARIRTVNKQQNKPYHQLIRAFAEQTGVPVLVNTSFNTRGEPVVYTPRDAVESFWTSPLDALVIGLFSLEKKQVSQREVTAEVASESTIIS